MKIFNEVSVLSDNKEIYKTHNTITNLGLKAISELSKYGEYLLVGTSQTIQLSNVSELLCFHSAYQTYISDYNFDSKKGDLYVVKTAEIKSNTSFNIGEMGLSYKDFSNHIINYITVKNDDNEPSFIPVLAEKPIYVSIKIIFQLDEDYVFFTGGDNIFVKGMFGLVDINKDNLYFLRGGNLQKNSVAVDCPLPLNSSEGKLPLSININVDFNIEKPYVEFDFMSSDINIQNKNEIYELIILYQEQPVARIDFSTRNIKSIEKTYTSSILGEIDLEYKVEQLQSVIRTEDNTIMENISINKNFVNGFGFGVEKAFEENITVNTPRYISLDGKKIAFLIDDKLHVFENLDFTLKKLNTNAFIMRNDIEDIIIQDKYIVILSLNNSAFMDVYEFDNGVLRKLSVDNTGLVEVIGEVLLHKIDVAINGDEIRLGISQGENKNGYVIKYLKNAEGGFSYSSCVDIGLYGIELVIALSKCEFNEKSQIVFVCDYYEGEKYYKTINYCGDTLISTISQNVGGALRSYTVSCIKKSQAVICRKQILNDICLFLDGFKRFNLLNSGIKNIAFDSQMRNVFYSLTNGEIKFKSMMNYEGFVDITQKFPTYAIALQNIQAVEFLYDSALIFANSEKGKVFLIQTPRQKTTIGNLEEQKEYSVKMRIYDNPGASGEYDIFKTKITLKLEKN